MQCAVHLNFEVSSVEGTTLWPLYYPPHMNEYYTLDLFQDFLQFLFFFYSIDKHVVVLVILVYTILHLMMDVPLNVY